MSESLQSPYLTAAKAARYLRLEERTLNNMRWHDEGPHWRKHGGKVIYHIKDLEGWSRSRDCGHGLSYDQEKDNDNGA